MGIKIEGLAQPTPAGVISTQGGITFTVIPSPQPQQGQRFAIPKVSPQGVSMTGINPLTIKPVGSTPGTPTGVNTIGNLTVKSIGANQAAAGANPVPGNINVKPVGASPGTPTVTIAGLSVTQAGLVAAGKTSITQTPGGAVGMTAIPNLQFTTATLQQPATGLQQSSNGGIQQLQIPANLQAQAAQLGGQFILIKTEQGQPALGMLQKGGLSPQQLQGAQIIGGAPIRLEPKLGASGKGPVKMSGTGDLSSLQAQQLAAAHQLLTKDKVLTKKNKAIKQIQIQPAAMVRAPLQSPTTQMQQIQARFQGFQTPGSPQPTAKGITQAQTRPTSPVAPATAVSPSGAAAASQIRPVIQLPKVIFKQQPQPSGSKSPATATIASATTPIATTPTLQSFPIPPTPTSNIVTTVAGSVAGTTFAQPIIVNQGQQRFILQTAPTNAQPGKPPPLVPVATQLTGQKFKLVPAAKGVVPPVSLTSATVAQQLAQTRPRLTGPLAQQLRPASSTTATTATTQPLPSPVVSQVGPQGLNISQQQLLQAGLRQPLPPGTQLHITSTSKGLQLQPIQSISTVSTPTLVSPRMTVAQNLQLQAQAKLAPRIPTTSPTTTTIIPPQQQGSFANLQGKITTLGQLGALSNAHLLAGSSIQVQGSLPQTSMMTGGQVTSPAMASQQTLPLQATIIPSPIVSSSQPSAVAGQIVVQQQQQALQQTLGAAVGQGKAIVGSTSSASVPLTPQQQPLQARVVYQQADQGQVAGTSGAVPANISIQVRILSYLKKEL